MARTMQALGTAGPRPTSPRSRRGPSLPTDGPERQGVAGVRLRLAPLPPLLPGNAFADRQDARQRGRRRRERAGRPASRRRAEDAELADEDLQTPANLDLDLQTPATGWDADDIQALEWAKFDVTDPATVGDVSDAIDMGDYNRRKTSSTSGSPTRCCSRSRAGRRCRRRLGSNAFEATAEAGLRSAAHSPSAI